MKQRNHDWIKNCKIYELKKSNHEYIIMTHKWMLQNDERIENKYAIDD